MRVSQLSPVNRRCRLHLEAGKYGLARCHQDPLIADRRAVGTRETDVFKRGDDGEKRRQLQNHPPRGNFDNAGAIPKIQSARVHASRSDFNFMLTKLCDKEAIAFQSAYAA